MIEIEVRSKIESTNGIKNRLKEIGAKSEGSIRQSDRIFGHKNFLDENNMIIEGGISARIRTVNEKSTLEFKEISRAGAGFEIISNLSSTEIGMELLEKLGFTEAFTVAKQRDVYSCDGFEIAVDNVEGLGYFVEIEKMIAHGDDKEKAKKECTAFLKRLGENLAIENRKYGDLIQEKINQNK